ncbi:hypothetical protein BO70DRAFT_397628 [Aspergillus heteromorphus CBS 117.55]|uniref:Aminoglycoside phosphotransferase domain-containing protein n=1 Tax=Aspergillus heteromorphus CBS 117.55 TaxID=1448321 RepID=A0A317VWE6_9EURO|nr:uncharacterized protein BO70DRAFT_397628 [Aspergillus heteromorphus CBS 117.55]PWY77337.1 hypothetical protein BO70DRAFT_397628 [Aspergillus heteromorphus CBS 117.55]
MASQTWFPKHLVSPNLKIKLDRKEWIMMEKLSEHDFQKDENDLREGSDPSFSCIRLRCRSRDSGTPAFMRIYMQIPLAGAGIQLPQACSFIPDELTVLRTMTEHGCKHPPLLLDCKEASQDESGLVRGGFITWIVYEIVPGVRLGDVTGADRFWNLRREERREIQKALPEAYGKMISNGFYPAFEGADNLVWDSVNKHLYFVGFRLCNEAVPPCDKWRPGLYAVFSVAKPPSGSHWYLPTWDGNMRGWEW